MILTSTCPAPFGPGPSPPPGGGLKRNVALAHSHHVRRSYTAYGRNPSSALEGETITDNFDLDLPRHLVAERNETSLLHAAII